MRFNIIQGPNLNLLGRREPEIYGTQTLEEIHSTLQSDFPDHQFQFTQSNHEGELIDAIQNNTSDAIIINPGGFSHTSVALHDAINACEIPVIEVHLSNPHARESFRHRFLTGAAADGVICGLGSDGYRVAIMHLMQRR